MLALWVWVDFKASWRVGNLFKKSSFLCLEGHLASRSEGHFLKIMFERTLFEDCVWKINGTVYDSFNQFLLGIEENSPLGKDWSTVDAEPMKHVSCKNFHF